MKKKEKDQLHSMSIPQLRKELSDVGKKRSTTRNVREDKTVREKRAVLLTILREKELTV